MIEKNVDKVVQRLFYSSRSWIEGEALRQFENAAGLSDMRYAVALPDLHPGKGAPIGAAYFAGKTVYPFLLGNDVGCGIGLWMTSLSRAKAKPAKIEKKLTGLEVPWQGDLAGALASAGLDSTGFDQSLGTIGGGNHFAELQVVDKVLTPEVFAGPGMSKDRVCLLVHSGSRGLGEILLRRHTEVFGAGGLECESGEGVDYLQGHDYAVRWAALNRQVIATRFCENLGIEAIRVLDNCHNQVTPAVVAGHQGWLHRKGAAQADRGLLVIPGSRGAFSYLVEPRGFQERNLWSLAHGAGRKWSRKSCKDRLRERTSPEALRRSSLGSTVICEDRELLFEEAPQAYKNIETVIEDMVGEELIRVVATLRPLVTYKTRKN